MIGVLADALALHDGPSQVVRYEARADEMSVSGGSGGSHSTAGMPASSRAWTLLSNEYGSRIQYDRASSVLVMQRLSQSAQEHIVRWLRRYGLPSNITEISVSNSKRGGDHHPSEFVDAIMTSVAARCAACVEDDTLPRLDTLRFDRCELPPVAAAAVWAALSPPSAPARVAITRCSPPPGLFISAVTASIAYAGSSGVRVLQLDGNGLSADIAPALCLLLTYPSFSAGERPSMQDSPSFPAASSPPQPPPAAVHAAAATIVSPPPAPPSLPLHHQSTSLSASATPVLSSLSQQPQMDTLHGQGAPPPSRVRRGCLAELHLTGNKLGPMGVLALCEALKFNNTLTRLRLFQNGLNAESGRQLGGMLVSNTHLQHLSVSYTELGSAGVVQLCAGAKSNVTLQGLFLGTERLDGPAEVAARSMVMCRHQAILEQTAPEGGAGGGSAIPALQMGTLGLDFAARRAGGEAHPASSAGGGTGGGLAAAGLGGGGGCSPFMAKCLDILRACDVMQEDLEAEHLGQNTRAGAPTASVSASPGAKGVRFQDAEGDTLGGETGASAPNESKGTTAAADVGTERSSRDVLSGRYLFDAFARRFAESIGGGKGGGRAGKRVLDSIASDNSKRARLDRLRQRSVDLLAAAAASGDVEGLHDVLPLLARRLYITCNHLARGPLTDHSPPRRQTPLIAACRGGHEEAVQELLDFYVYSEGQVGVFDSDLAVLSAVTQEGVQGGGAAHDVSSPGGFMGTPPHPLKMSWVGSGLSLSDETGQGPLYHAASCGHRDIVQLLLAAWEHVDARRQLKELRGWLEGREAAGAQEEGAAAERLRNLLEEQAAKYAQRRVSRLMTAFRGSISSSDAGVDTELAAWLIQRPTGSEGEGGEGGGASAAAMSSATMQQTVMLQESATSGGSPGAAGPGGSMRGVGVGSSALQQARARVTHLVRILGTGGEYIRDAAFLPGGAGLDPSAPLFEHKVHRPLEMRLTAQFRAQYDAVAEGENRTADEVAAELRALQEQAAALLGRPTERWTALMEVCHMRPAAPVSLVRFFVEAAHSNVNARGQESGDTALSIAFRRGNFAIAKYLASLDDIDMFPALPPVRVPVLLPPKLTSNGKRRKKRPLRAAAATDTEAPVTRSHLEQHLSFRVQYVVLQPLPSDVRFHRILSSLLPLPVQASMWSAVLSEATDAAAGMHGSADKVGTSRASFFFGEHTQNTSEAGARQRTGPSHVLPFEAVPIGYDLFFLPPSELQLAVAGSLGSMAGKLSSLRFLLDSGFDASQLSHMAVSADNVYTHAAGTAFEAALVAAVHQQGEAAGGSDGAASSAELLLHRPTLGGIAHHSAARVAASAPPVGGVQLTLAPPSLTAAARADAAEVRSAATKALATRLSRAAAEGGPTTLLPVPLPCFPHLVAGMLFKRGAAVAHVLTNTHAAEAQTQRLALHRALVEGGGGDGTAADAARDALAVRRPPPDPLVEALKGTPHTGEPGTQLPVPDYPPAHLSGVKGGFGSGLGSGSVLPPIPAPPPGVLAWGRIPFLTSVFASDSGAVEGGQTTGLNSGDAGATAGLSVDDPAVRGLVSSWVPFLRVGPRCNVRQLFLWLVGLPWGPHAQAEGGSSASSTNMGSQSHTGSGPPGGVSGGDTRPLFGLDRPSTLVSIVDSQDSQAGRLGSATRDLVREVSAAAGDGKAWIVTDGSMEGADGYVAQLNAQSSRPRPVIGITSTPDAERMASVPTHWFTNMPDETRQAVLGALAAALAGAGGGDTPLDGAAPHLPAQCWTAGSSGFNSDHTLFIFVDDADEPGVVTSTPVEASEGVEGGSPPVHAPPRGLYSSSDEPSALLGGAAPSDSVAVQVPTVAHLLGFSDHEAGLDAVSGSKEEAGGAGATPAAADSGADGDAAAGSGLATLSSAASGALSASVAAWAHLTAEDLQPPGAVDARYRPPANAPDLALPVESDILDQAQSVAAAFRRSFEHALPLHAGVRFVIGGDLTDLVVLYHSTQLTSFQQLSPGFANSDWWARMHGATALQGAVQAAPGHASRGDAEAAQGSAARVGPPMELGPALWNRTARVVRGGSQGLLTDRPTVLLGTHGAAVHGVGAGMGQTPPSTAGVEGGSHGLASTLADLSLERADMLAQARYTGTSAFASVARSLVEHYSAAWHGGIAVSTQLDAAHAAGAAARELLPHCNATADEVAAFDALAVGAEALSQVPTPCLAVDEALLGVREQAARVQPAGMAPDEAWQLPAARVHTPRTIFTDAALRTQWLLPSEAFPPVLGECMWGRFCAVDASNANPLFPARHAAFRKLLSLIVRIVVRRGPMTYLAALQQYGAVMAQCWGKARAVVQAGFAAGGGARSSALGEAWCGLWGVCRLQHGAAAKGGGVQGGGTSTPHHAPRSSRAGSVRSGARPRQAGAAAGRSTPSAGGGTLQVGSVVVIEHLNVGFFGSPPDFPGLPWDSVLAALGQTAGAALLASRSDTLSIGRPLSIASPRHAGQGAHGERLPPLTLPQQAQQLPSRGSHARRHSANGGTLDDLGADESTQQMLRLEAELTHADHAITGAELSQRRVEKTGSVGAGGGRGGTHAAGGTAEGEFGQKRTSDVALRLRSAILRRLAPSPGQQLHEGQGREWLKLSALWDCDSLIHETLTQRRRLRTAPMPKSERVVLADVLSFAWLEDDPVLVNTLLKNGLLEDPHPFHLLSRHVCDALDRTTLALTTNGGGEGAPRDGVWGGGFARRFELPTAHASTRLVTERLLQWYTAFARYFDSRTAALGALSAALPGATDSAPVAQGASTAPPHASTQSTASSAADPLAIRRQSVSSRGLFSPQHAATQGGSSRRLGATQNTSIAGTVHPPLRRDGDDAVFRTATEVFQKPRWLAECQEALRVLRIAWAAINGKFRVARALLSHTTQPLRTSLLVALVLRKLADQGQLSNTSVLNDVDELLEQAEVFESLAIRLLTAVHDESVSIHWTEPEKAQAALWILTPAGPAWAVVDAALAVLLAPYSTAISRTFVFHAVDPLVAPDVLGWALGGAALGASTTKDILRLAVRGGCRRFLALDVVQSLISNVWNSGTWLRGEAQAALVAAGHGTAGGRWMRNTTSALATPAAARAAAGASPRGDGGGSSASLSGAGTFRARSSRSMSGAASPQASSSSLLAVKRALRAQGGGGTRRALDLAPLSAAVVNPLQPGGGQAHAGGAAHDTASRSVGHASLVAVRAAVRMQRLQRMARMATAQKALQVAQRARNRVASMRSRGDTLEALEANLASLEADGGNQGPAAGGSPQRWASGGALSPGRGDGEGMPLASMPLETFITEFRLQCISRHLARLGVRETIDLFVLVEDDRVAGNLSRIHWSRLGAAVSALKSMETLEGRAWRLMSTQQSRRRGRDAAQVRGRRVSSARGGYASSGSDGSADSAFGSDADSVPSQDSSDADSEESSVARSASLSVSVAGSALGTAGSDSMAGDRRPGYVLTMDVFRQNKVKAHLQRLQTVAGGAADAEADAELSEMAGGGVGGIGTSADALLEGPAGWEGGAQGGHALMTDVNALSTHSGISLTSTAREAALYVLPLTDVRRCAVLGVAYASTQARLLHVAPSWGGGADANTPPRWALHSAGLLTQPGEGGLSGQDDLPVARFVIKTVPSWWAAVQAYLASAWPAAGAVVSARAGASSHGSVIASSSSGRLGGVSGRGQELAAQFLVTELAAWTRLLLWAQQRRAEAQFQARRRRLQRSLFALRTVARRVAAGDAAADSGEGATAHSPQKTPPSTTHAAPDGAKASTVGPPPAVTAVADESLSVIADAYSSGANALHNFDALMSVLPHTLTRVYSLITAPVREVPSMDDSGQAGGQAGGGSAGQSRRDLLRVATGAGADGAMGADGAPPSVSTEGVHVAGGRLSVRVVGLLMKFHPLGDLRRMFQCMRVARAAVSAQLAGTAAQAGVQPLLLRRGAGSGGMDWGELGAGDLTLAGRGVLQSLHAARVTRSPATAAMSVLYWALWGLRDVLRIAWQVADALSTLHSAGIIHNDVGAHNVLLRAVPHDVLDLESAAETATATATSSADAGEGASSGGAGGAAQDRPHLHASLTDLGWAVLVRPTQGAVHDSTAMRKKRRSMRKRAGATSTAVPSEAAGGGAGTELDVVTLPAFRPVNVKWCAPETLGSNAEVSRASDVYSFGVLLFELATGGEAPWRGDSDDMVRLNVREGMTLEGALPAGVPPGLRALMRACWALDPRERPSIDAVRGQLAALWEEQRALEARTGGGGGIAWSALVQRDDPAPPSPGSSASAGAGADNASRSPPSQGTPPRHTAQPSTDSVTGLDLGSSGSGSGSDGDGGSAGDSGEDVQAPTPQEVANALGPLATRLLAPSSAQEPSGADPSPEQAAAAQEGGGASPQQPPASPEQRATAFAGEMWRRLYAETVDTLAAEMLNAHSLVPGALRSAALPDVHGRVAASRLRARDAAGGAAGGSARSNGSNGSGSTGRSTYRIFGHDSDSDDSDEGATVAADAPAALEATGSSDGGTSTYGSRTAQLFAPAVKHAMYGWSELCFVLLHSAVLLTTEPRFADRDACCATDGALRSVVSCPSDAEAAHAVAASSGDDEHDLTFHASLALKLLLFWWCMSAALSDCVGGGAARFRLLIAKFNILKYVLMALAAVSQTIAWLSSAAGNECLGYVSDISTYTLLIVVAFVAYPLLLEYLSTGSYLGPRVFTIANGAAYSMVDVFVFLLLFGLVVSSFVIPLISLFVVSPFGQNSLGEITELLWSVFGDWELPVDFRADPRHADSSALTSLGVALMAAYLVAALVILLNILIAVLADSYQTARDTSRGAWNVYRIEMLWRYMHRSPVPPPCYFPLLTWAAACRREGAVCCLRACPGACAACCLPDRLLQGMARGEPALLHAVHHRGALHGVSCMCCGRRCGGVSSHTLHHQHGTAQQDTADRSVTGRILWALRRCGLGCSVQRRVHDMLSPTDPAGLAGMPPTPPGLAATARVAGVRVFGTNKI